MLIVAMGATAVRSVCGKPLTIGRVRGRVMPLAGERWMLATVHPSFILRIRDDDDRRAEFRHFVADLRNGLRFLASAV